MIAYLEGTVQAVDEGSIVVMTQGIGWLVGVPRVDRYGMGVKVALYIEHTWNQEHGPALFGFATGAERLFFQLVTSCSGFGPKLALSLLAQLSVAQCVTAIMSNDTKMLSSIKGIGAKKAELLIMHLRSKCAQLPDLCVDDVASSGVAGKMRDVSDALHALRYSPAEVTRALETVRQHSTLETATFDHLLRIALATLAK